MSSLTLFTWPKSFADPLIATIQRNAVRSWLKLDPKPSILVFGDEQGTAQFCAEFGLQHVTGNLETILGVVTMRDLSTRAEALSNTSFYCFVNADIILTNDLLVALDALSQKFRKFLLGGSPWNLDVSRELEFDPGWEETLKRQAIKEGELRGYNCSDFFVFPKGFLKCAPALLVGRNHIDNGLMWFARKQGAALVDGTSGVLTIHQNHHYHHVGTGDVSPNGGREAEWNEKCVGGKLHLFTWANATHHYTPTGIRPYLAGQLWRLGDFSETASFLHRLFAWITWPLRILMGIKNPRLQSSLVISKKDSKQGTKKTLADNASRSGGRQ